MKGDLERRMLISGKVTHIHVLVRCNLQCDQVLDYVPYYRVVQQIIEGFLSAILVNFGNIPCIFVFCAILNY